MAFRNRLKKQIFRSRTAVKERSFGFKMGRTITFWLNHLSLDLIEMTLCKCAGISTTVKAEPQPLLDFHPNAKSN